MLEVYRSQVSIAFKSKQITTTFFFLVDNITGSHCHRIASGINLCYTVTTDWLFYFSSMISEKAFIRRFSTQRIRPNGCASAYNAYGPDEFPGRYLGDCADNFITGNIQWIVDAEPTNHHQVRIGPLGEGATQDNGWYPIFSLSAENFMIEHLTLRSLDTGDTSQGCINHATSGGSLIEAGQLMWPPGRQANRRWRP